MMKFEYYRLEAKRKISDMIDEHTIILIEPDGNILYVHDKTLTEVLNELGERGWELVTSTETYYVDDESSSNYCNCILKRQVVD